MDAMSGYETLYATLFGVRKSVRYHQRRRGFFESAHTAAAALQLIAGSSAVAAVVGELTTLAMWLAAAAAVLAALDLTIGTTRRATVHAGLAQQFAQLEREMVEYENDESVNAETAVRFRQRRLEIEEREPPKLRVVDVLCHNELVTSTYRHEKTYPVGWARRWVGHVFDVEVADVLANPTDVPALVRGTKGS